MGSDITRKQQTAPYIRGIVGDVKICDYDLTSNDWIVRTGLRQEYESVYLFNTTYEYIAKESIQSHTSSVLRAMRTQRAGNAFYEEYQKQLKEGFENIYTPQRSLLSNVIPQNQIRGIHVVLEKRMPRGKSPFPDYSLGYFKSNLNIQKDIHKQYVLCIHGIDDI